MKGKKDIALCLGVLAVFSLTGVPLHAAAPAFNIERIGLVGEGYTQQNGSAYSSIKAVNNAGHVVGLSERHSATNNDSYGRVAWLYDGSSTVRIGLTGAGYVSPFGRESSTIVALNETGQVAGTSRSFGSEYGLYGDGTSAWLYDGGSTVRIGLTGTGYTRRGGSSSSSVSALNAVGQVVGTSARYNAADTTLYGHAAWLYDGGTTVQIGLTGVGYTSQNGTMVSAVSALNDAGQVAGTSERYQVTDNNWHGRTAWLYSGGSTVQIGLTGAGFANSSGLGHSDIVALNNAGQVVGKSFRYSGANGRGEAAWLYDGSSTVQIGLAGLGFTSLNGTANSVAQALNEAGQVAGISTRYDAADNNDHGQAAWLYDSGSTVLLGLSGPGYTSLSGVTVDTVAVLNDAGQVAGASYRYNAANDDYYGQATWLFDGSSTVQIGLAGAGYTRQDGFAMSIVRAMNNAGQVAGDSERYNAADNIWYGQDAWLYDPALNQTVTFTLDTRATDGFAYSKISYLSEDGMALGSYESFDDVTGASLGNRAFYYKLGEGLFDLGMLIGDLGVDGWTVLAGAIGNDTGTIVGTGSFTNPIGYGHITGAYILRPGEVPLPATAWLLGGGLAGLVGLAKRRKAR